MPDPNNPGRLPEGFSDLPQGNSPDPVEDVNERISGNIAKIADGLADQAKRAEEGQSSDFIPSHQVFYLASGGKISVQSYHVKAVISGEESPEPGRKGFKTETCRIILASGASFTVIGKGDEVRKDLGQV